MGNKYSEICLICGKKNDREGFYCLSCSDKKRKASTKKSYKKNREKRLLISKLSEEKYKSPCPDCGKPMYRGSSHCKKCYVKHRIPNPRKYTEEEREKFRGENSGKSWKGGVSRRYGRRIAKATLKEECSICKSTKNIDVHHIDSNLKNNSKDNLMRVCRSCHKNIHNGNIKIEEGIVV